MRHKDDQSFDAESERLDIQAETDDIDQTGKLYPIGSPIEPVRDESAAEHNFHVEKDHDGAEGDEGLISGSDPNFEHLVKPQKDS